MKARARSHAHTDKNKREREDWDKKKEKETKNFLSSQKTEQQGRKQFQKISFATT